jgi:hypothetical protein
MPTIMPRMPVRPVLVAVAVLAAFVVGCGRASPEVTPTAEEQHLIDIIRTDGFILVNKLERDAKGFLVVTTRQGVTTVRYQLAAPAGQPLRIQRIEDRVELAVGDDGTRGTGPETRGLR